MDLRDWILADHEAVGGRLDREILALVPRERWLERPGDGGTSVAWCLWHVARHHDLAVNCVLRGRPPVLDDWSARVGADRIAAGGGMSETEDPDVSAVLNLDELDGYLTAARAEAQTWLTTAPLDDLAGVPDAAAGLADLGGVPEDGYDWLYSLWAGQPRSFFIQWSAIGHPQNHVGEMVAVRNRMGLSPF